MMIDSRSRRGVTAPTFLAAASLVALMGMSSCSSSSDGAGDGGNVTVPLETLSGNVREAGGAALENVTVSVGMSSAVTNRNGDFVIPSVGTIGGSQVTVRFDGTTSLGAGTYPIIDVTVPLPAGTRNLVVPQTITLPNLASAASAAQTVMAAAGVTTEPIDANNGTSGVGIAGATGTAILIDGMPGGASIDLNVTPVEPDEVPTELPDGLIGMSFVTVQPANGAFDQPGAPTGLDATFPNLFDLPVGTMVDIWSFDESTGRWVNRSAETGNQGVVQTALLGLSTEIFAQGVVTNGGWHTPVLAADNDCTTTVTGRIIDDVTMEGIAGANVSLDTGQFATTNANGVFTIQDVPAYDVNDSVNCTAVSITYEAVLPPSFGSETSGSVTIAAMNIVPGGTTDLSDIAFTVPTTGSVAGLINAGGAPIKDDVELRSGLNNISVTPNENGSFFAPDLAPGDWTATFHFEGQLDPTERDFIVRANEIATVNLQFAAGTGSQTISVLVVREDGNDFTSMDPIANAYVVLKGTDNGSRNGFVMTTGLDGMATFENVDGPFTVTAQYDDYGGNQDVRYSGGSSARYATSIVDVTPTGNTIGLPILTRPVPNLPPPVDSFSGTVSNLPTLSGTQRLDVYVTSTGDQSGWFQTSGLVDAQGNYGMSVPPSTDFDCFLVLSDPQATSQVIETVFLPGVGQTVPPLGVGGNGSLVLDIDWANADVVTWDQPVSIAFTNTQNDTNLSMDVEFLDFAAGVEFEAPIYSGPNTSNVTLMLPDLADTALDGYKFGLSTGIDGQDFQVDYDHHPAATPSSLTFDFLTPSTPIVPFDEADYSDEEFVALDASFMDSGNGSFTNSGLNMMNFDRSFFAEAGGFDFVSWTIFTRAGDVAFDLPRTAQFMFGYGEFISARLQKIRVAGHSVGFGSFFNENVDQNWSDALNNMTRSSTAERFFDFRVGDFEK